MLGLVFRWKSVFLSEVLILILILLMLILNSKWDLDQTLYLYSFSSLIVIIISLNFTHKKINLTKSKLRADIIKNSLNSSKFIFIVGVSGILITNLDTIIVGRIIGFEEAGIYSISVKLGALISLPLIAANTNLSSTIANYHFLNKTDDLNKQLEKSSRSTILSFFILFILIVFGKLILTLWGESFTYGYQLLLIIGCAHLINSIIGPAGLILNLCNKEKVHYRLSIYSTLTLIITIIPSTILLGTIGAALSSALTIIFSNFLKLYFVKKHLHYQPSFY